ncbi:DUF6443 domain-containing protein [Mucilaginibacter sp. AW1-3]
MKRPTRNKSAMSWVWFASLVAIALQCKAQSADTTLNTAVTTAKVVRATHRISLSPGFSGNGTNGIIHFVIVPPLVQSCVPLAANLSSDQNYVQTMVPRVPITDPSTLSSKNTCEVMESVQYFDGLGRLAQTVQVKGAPSADKDIVSLTAYDPFGREAIKYLPYASATADGSYKATGFSDQWNYYDSPPTGVAPNYFPASQTMFDSSPLSKAVEQGFPGDAFQPGAYATDDGGHTVKTERGYNTATGDRAVRMYLAGPGTGSERVLSSSGNYPLNQLYLTITKNENWSSGKSGTAEEYKDKEERVVLKRIWQDESTPLSTYYVYDDMGNLSFVLPPGSHADSATPSGALFDNFCYQYRYDARKRLVEKKIPGSGWQYTVYNLLDQVVATQDNNQRINNEWIITKYDTLRRAVVTGIWTNTNTAISPSSLKALVDTHGLSELRDNAQTYGYTLNQSYPTSLDTILSINYYDDYNISGLPYDHHTENSTMTKGLETAGRINVLGTTELLWSANYYDDLGRTTHNYNQHYLNGSSNLNTANYDHNSTSYDFSGSPINIVREHYINNSGTPSLTVALKDSLAYDHLGRKRQSWSKINSGQQILLSQVDYNEIGQMQTKHLHSENNGTSFLQDVSFDYNVRGWLTDIGSSKFSMNIAYNTGLVTAATPQYNGNIAEMSYRGDYSGSKGFSYTYDAINRLTNAVSSDGALNEAVAYDGMGNITSLNRSGASPASLSYTYASSNQSNQLTSVTNGGSSFRNYAYDANGNATSDGGSQAINYNSLNLPVKVTQGATVKSTYTYNAAGIKIRNIGTDGTWDYDNGIVYQNNAISFIQTEEGRASRNPSDGTYRYEYNLKDHLGNTRVSFDKGTDGSARVIQEDEYYAFGLRKQGGYDLSNNNRYLYNGKEIQTDLANQYDYGARFYDPVIGRWTSVDPLAEDYNHLTPYNYVENNPILMTDPDGMGSDTTKKVTPPSPKKLKEVTITAKKESKAGIGAILLSAAASVPKPLLVFDSFVQEIPIVNALADAVTVGYVIYDLTKDKHIKAIVPKGKVTRVSDNEIKNMKAKGFDPHDHKPQQGNTGGKIDLWKDVDGNLFFRTENGTHYEPLYENINSILK